jgi:hypothetical protein
VKKIQQLQSQHEEDRQQIEQLLKTQETYKSLAERERKHAVEQYEKLLERRTKELEAANAARKSLEAEVAQLRRQRQPPRNEKKGRFPQMLNGCVDVPQQLNDGLQQSNGAPRRPSRVPLPVRPSTPLRPNYGRESPSGNNTMTSSVDSAFSKTTAASGGSIDSGKSIRSVSPESPISPKVTQLPLVDGTQLSSSKETLPPSPASPGNNVKEEGGSTTRPVMRTMRTWAEITRKPAMEKITPVIPLQNGAKKEGVFSKTIKTRSDMNGAMQ